MKLEGDIEGRARFVLRVVLAAAAAGSVVACGPNVVVLPAEGAVGEDASEATSSASTTTSATTTSAETTAAETTGPAPDDTTGPVMGCGNGIVEAGEQCDGEELAGATCLNLFGYPGDVTCTAECAFDVTGCHPPGMILIPAGDFEMGSDSFYDDERPAHQVYLDAFYIDEDAVTKEDYADCVQAGGCTVPGSGSFCNWPINGRFDHPINCVDWDQAAAYCEWAGGIIEKRLPTEAEWEKAARGDDGRLWPWGNVPLPSCDYVVMDEGLGGGCGVHHSHPVGSRPMGDSPYGVHDMAGNAWNWVADWYAPYDLGETDNPTGPQSGNYKIIRGGGWATDEINWFRTSARNPSNSGGGYNVGFRCVQAPPTIE